VKAVLTMKDGMTVSLEGNPEEVSSVLSRFEDPSGSAMPKSGQSSKGSTAKLGATPTTLISELVREGFFRVPRELGSVTQALRERGHFYPVTTLSPAMLRLVRRKELRRIKEKGRWMYVG
jgi:hypothetical protein